MKQKRSGWASVAGIVTIILVKIFVAAMRHSDWDSGDWIAYAAIAIVVIVIVYGVTLLIKQKGASSSETAPATESATAVMTFETMAPPLPERVALPAEPGKTLDIQKSCRQCGSIIEADARFCCECGTAA